MGLDVPLGEILTRDESVRIPREPLVVRQRSFDQKGAAAAAAALPLSAGSRPARTL